jgi:hypothetical protein
MRTPAVKMALALCMALAGAQPAAGDPARRGPMGTDLWCSAGETRKYAQLLASPKAGEWREAQQRLAWSDAEGLQVVDSLLVAGMPLDSARVRGYVSLALEASVTPEECDSFTHLHAVVESRIAQGLAMVPSLAVDKVIEGSAFATMNHLIQLDGLAIPAALQLCTRTEPLARARGVQVLLALHAVSRLPRLEAMRSDAGRYTFWDGDHFSSSTVGATAAGAAESLKNSLTGQYRYELLIPPGGGGAYRRDPYVLINNLRAFTSVLAESTWDGWWTAARPAWNAYWEVCGDAPTPASVEAWTTRLEATQDWRADAPGNGSKRAGVNLLGPPSTRGELWIGNRMLRSSLLPLRVGDVLAALGAKSSGGSEYTLVRLIAHGPGGHHWELPFEIQPGHDLTVTLLDRPRAPLE